VIESHLCETKPCGFFSHALFFPDEEFFNA